MTVIEEGAARAVGLYYKSFFPKWKQSQTEEQEIRANLLSWKSRANH
jgi:hypothetical protein